MKPKEVVRLYLERHNAHDVEGVIDLYADNARYEMAGRFVRCGKPEIRMTEEWEAAVNDSLRAGELVEADGEVSFRAFESNDWLRASGVTELRYTSMTVRVESDHITHVMAVVAPDSLAVAGRH